MATKLNAVLRPVGGKGNARSTRRAGQVPAVIYGNKESPILIALEKNKISPFIFRTGFLTHLMELDIDGKSHSVLPRDVQFDPVSDQPLHIDFLRVTSKTEIRVNVPVVFRDADKAPGVKRGGVLNIVSHELEVFALAAAIPEQLEINVGKMEIGDSLHLGALDLPKGVRLVHADASQTIVTVAPPTVQAEDPTAAAAATAAPAKGKGGKAAPAKAAAAPAAAAPAKKK